LHDTAIATAIKTTLDFANQRLGQDVRPGAKILDFGCGIGRSVEALLTLGYDGWGVEIKEYWGKDHREYWDQTSVPPVGISDRLRVADITPYKLPFPDHSFDFIISEQVMEHVFDYVTVFRELVRVMKPGAISVHRFPGPGRLVENHLNVPFPPLCRRRLYLIACAMLGFRNPQQTGYGWRETVAENVSLMDMNNYPTKRTLRRHAREAGVSIRFTERDEFIFRTGNHLLASLGPLLQRYMVIRS
jgi:SAM-dependent methyltransferase